MHRLSELFKKEDKKIIGLMSGTSLDGIDVALVRILDKGQNTKIDLRKFISVPYQPELKSRLKIISQAKSGTVDEICRLNFVMAEFYVEAIRELCDTAQVPISEIDLIGSHGQTIHHLPDLEMVFGKNIRSTLQIGEPAIIAAKTGVITVGNFRSADMALGGQGAPLVPYFDFIFFSSDQYNRVLLNIGGIANITVLPKAVSSDQVKAFDTGPGNMVIDALMQLLFGQPYDKDGEMAQSGTVSKELLDELKRFPFFQKPAPKSTGREDFGDKFVRQILVLAQSLNLSATDIIATATELTVSTIAEAMKFSSLKITTVDQLIVSGGGSHNQFIMNALKKSFPSSDILLSADFGIPVDAKEAICFAVLANETICGCAANLPSVTGAKRPAILGSISCP